MSNFNTPSINEDFNSDPYVGSMQQILSTNIGNSVICDFLIGTNTTASKAGILYNVGVKYLTLFNKAANTYTVCDIFAIKFVTFINEDIQSSRTMYQK